MYWWILLIVLDIPAILGCGGGDAPSYYYYYYYGTESTTASRKRRRTRQVADAVDRNLHNAWDGFMPSKEEEAVWRDWLERYNQMKEDEKKNSKDPSKYANERGPGSGWPSSWLGLGEGSSGVVAPPWAYQPIDTGLPSFCSQPPLYGKCDDVITRWAFNPYTAQCSEFEYSSCGGNQNNFLTMAKCEQSCMKMPVNGCNPKKKQWVEYNNMP